MSRRGMRTAVLMAALAAGGCQTPTNPDDAITFDESVDVSAAPDPITADTATGGRTYRVVRGNNQPDEILAYDWHAIFTTTLSLNSNAQSNDVDVAFPVRLTATTIAVKQASGGIVTTPTGGETEKYEFVISASGNQVASVGAPITTTYEIWYDLPSLRKEAIVTVTFSFTDNDGQTYQKSEDFRIAP